MRPDSDYPRGLFDGLFWGWWLVAFLTVISFLLYRDGLPDFARELASSACRTLRIPSSCGVASQQRLLSPMGLLQFCCRSRGPGWWTVWPPPSGVVRPAHSGRRISGPRRGGTGQLGDVSQHRAAGHRGCGGVLLGAIALVVVMPLASQIHDRPENQGQASGCSPPEPDTVLPDYTWREAVRSHPFWLLVVGDGCLSAVGMASLLLAGVGRIPGRRIVGAGTRTRPAWWHRRQRSWFAA